MFVPNPRSRAKERILAYGYMGSGKTYGWTEIASMYQQTDTPGTFYVVSTEFQSAERALEPYPDLENVVIIEALSWDELHSASAAYREAATGDDWLVIDSIAAAWQWVQDDHTQERWGKDHARYFGELERGKSEINWQVVNDEYRQFMLPNVIRFPGHVYACTPADELREVTGNKDPEDARIRRVFGRFGLKPVGQKDLAYQLHSILLFEQPRHGTFELTTVDDHARKALNHDPIINFPFSYLMGVAGWSVQ